MKIRRFIVATTRKTTTKSTAAKTKPAKKPTKKPAGASVKPKSYKAVASKATKPTTKPVAKRDHGKIVFVIILALAMAALAVGLVTCVIQNGANIVMIENGKGDKVESKYISLDGYDFEVAIPTSFIKSDKSTDNEAIYSDDTGSVVVAITKPKGELTNEQVKTQTETTKSILKSAMSDVTTDYIDNDGHTIGIIRAVNTTSKDKAFAEIAIFSYDDMLVTVTFECSDGTRAEWEKVGDGIVRSIRFKK